MTTNARLYKTADGRYWTQIVYGYDFFKRYLQVFDDIRLVAHTKNATELETQNMLRVDGPNVSIFEVPFPHGKMQYIKMYYKIKQSIKHCFYKCDVAILRIPDQLAFQIYPYLKKKNIPVGLEITSDSWEYFAPGSVKSMLRPFLRILWHIEQKRLCSTIFGTAYVTKFALQKRYPPRRAFTNDGFTTNYTDTNIDEKHLGPARNYSPDQKEYTIIHVSGNIGGHAKGHKELIEAIGMLSKKKILIKLVLVGAGSLSPDVNCLIEKYKLKDKIRYTGLIANSEDLRNELRLADIFVFPSYREGLPRVVIEAMSCGLPCIATKLSGIIELLDLDCLVPVRNSVLLKNKIEELIKSPKLLSFLSKRNVEKTKEYSIKKIEKKRIEFYLNIKNSAKKN